MANQAKIRAKVWTAGVAGARRGAAVLLPDGWAEQAERLRRTLAEWLAAEVTPGRLLPWLPVAFGCGIALYFTADREPAWWAACGLALGAIAIAIAARRRPAGFPLALGLAAMATGFCVITLHTARIAHPVLQSSTWTAQLAGFVETREEREKSDRIVVRVHSFDAARITEKPERVRVSVRKGTAPAVGDYVAFKAHLSPPLSPLRPGGYDFARDMYFQQIGASGYVLGKIRTETPQAAPSLWLRYAGFIDALRDGMDNRIRAALPGDRGAIASALITGKRDAISTPVNDAMYISSLAHVLSISGYHMAVVAGLVFFSVRAALALFSSLAVRRPIKKWAAGAALMAAAFYLLLSGAEVATQRSFIMVAIVLVGVMIDRAAITFRTLTVAAFCVLLIAPQAVAHPSFQMSFAATLALVAAYQFGMPGADMWRADRESALRARVALWGGREIAALLLASVVAGLATTPYAAFHFHRVAPYGVIANLLAMPVVSVMVMPMGILGALAMPFGFDAFLWRLMGAGLDWMIGVALWVTSLPGAVGHMPAFGTGPLLLVTLGLLLMCLLRTPLRWSGALAAVAACLWALNAPRPDVLVAADGQAAAIRGASGRLTLLASGRDSFAVKQWLAADGDARKPADASLKDGVTCDAIGCTAKLANGRIVAFALTAEAFEEDCTHAVAVASPRDAPSACAAALIDRRAWRAQGATALFWNGERFELSVARPAGLDRPWARAQASRPQSDSAPTIRRRAAPEATPAADTLEAGD
ncbi:MAG: ComEC/Rec2 family competence protein [Pseudolabrys sp.]|nr:ComEC/Rec2 family competence protein [Pseudolabrys sp.]MDP2296845.1 ComEC/Rec2 family competence protein [Pseudolabrys sp.]